jgi:hypothetical protein
MKERASLIWQSAAQLVEDALSKLDGQRQWPKQSTKNQFGDLKSISQS